MTSLSSSTTVNVMDGLWLSSTLSEDALRYVTLMSIQPSSPNVMMIVASSLESLIFARNTRDGGMEGGTTGVESKLSISKYELDQVYLFYLKNRFNFIIILKTIF
jgi:hypothetical protein